MKYLLLLTFLFLGITPAFADEPQPVAQKFIDGYITQLVKGGDSAAWLASSPLISPEFKKALKKIYSAEMVDADPILNAQDFPDKGFQAGPAKIKGEQASVRMKSRDASFDLQFTLKLTQIDGTWMISGSAP